MVAPQGGQTARFHAWITGRVQGVYFRAATKEKAQGLRLSGWVRNLPDGRVEAVFEGDANACREIALWCKVGPPGARVDGVALLEERPESLQGFEVRH